MFKKMSVLEKKQIYEDFLRTHGVFLIKAETEEVIQAEVRNVEIEKVAICKLSFPLKAIPKDPKVIVNFAVEEERYFIQTEMNIKGDDVFLDISVNLYQLQRRKTIRLDIPPEMQAKASIISHDGKVVYYEARILDYSAGGVRVSYQKLEPFFKVNDRVKCILHFEGRSSFEVEGVIRHTFAKGAVAELPQIFGVQFEPVRGLLQSKLATVFMDLQREIFNKYHADK